MAACNFTIDFAESATVLVEKMKSKILNQGGTFTGDESGGSLSVSLMGSGLSGSYLINGQQMEITIEKKPFFVSCNQIKSYLEGNL
jgi:hypothetical protein